ncbi:hypothetical protein LX16_2078 [Stackebrandtia albiflava]|uniref:Uncharacterized protein n=1 Tax=Stackebrandtia albiflava TaxID=406432 RepID=A0A562VEN8_9ACTN|nr:hypothetical protein [Stackebrandtia albiflava]TWJ16349.1 hypothetical protein LX16_2078 [Stackebrandtia albiflava]
MTNSAPQFSQPGPRTRPGTVTTAVVLQFLVVALTAVGVVFSLMYSADMTEAMRANLEEQGAAPDIVNSVSGGGDALTLIVTIVPALIYLVLAVFNLRGSNPARITTWVFSGLMLVCSLLTAGLAGLLSGMGPTDGVDIGEATEAGMAVLPSWYGAFTVVSMVVSIVCYLAVIILLALPASNRFFRKDRPQVILPGDA